MPLPNLQNKLNITMPRQTGVFPMPLPNLQNKLNVTMPMQTGGLTPKIYNTGINMGDFEYIQKDRTKFSQGGENDILSNIVWPLYSPLSDAEINNGYNNPTPLTQNDINELKNMYITPNRKEITITAWDVIPGKKLPTGRHIGNYDDYFTEKDYIVRRPDGGNISYWDLLTATENIIRDGVAKYGNNFIHSDQFNGFEITGPDSLTLHVWV
jgi:hypothetical protein